MTVYLIKAVIVLTLVAASYFLSKKFYSLYDQGKIFYSEESEKWIKPVTLGIDLSFWAAAIFVLLY